MGGFRDIDAADGQREGVRRRLEFSAGTDGRPAREHIGKIIDFENIDRPDIPLRGKRSCVIATASIQTAGDVDGSEISHGCHEPAAAIARTAGHGAADRRARDRRSPHLAGIRATTTEQIARDRERFQDAIDKNLPQLLAALSSGVEIAAAADHVSANDQRVEISANGNLSRFIRPTAFEISVHDDAVGIQRRADPAAEVARARGDSRDEDG